MVTREQLEQWLTALPTRQLPAEHERDLLAALHGGVKQRGLRRPIALWQGVAAGIAGLALGWLGQGAWSEYEAEPPPVVVEVRSNWFASAAGVGAGASATELNIANWSTLPPREIGSLPSGGSEGERE